MDAVLANQRHASRLLFLRRALTEESLWVISVTTAFPSINISPFPSRISGGGCVVSALWVARFVGGRAELFLVLGASSRIS